MCESPAAIVNPFHEFVHRQHAAGRFGRILATTAPALPTWRHAARQTWQRCGSLCGHREAAGACARGGGEAEEEGRQRLRGPKRRPRPRQPFFPCSFGATFLPSAQQFVLRRKLAPRQRLVGKWQHQRRAGGAPRH